MFYVRNKSTRPAAALLFTLAVSALAYAQASSPVLERNVRAGMTFLAGDALQGRGSGTQFERIAAEYIGSQFMQFGLEPAGEPGWDGKPGYVQTVPIMRRTFAAAPAVKAGSSVFTHGDTMLVWRTTTEAASGSLVKGDLTTRPAAGAAVLVRTGGTDIPRTAQSALTAMTAAGASLILIEETPQWRGTWANAAGRMPAFVAGRDKPAAMVIVSKAAFETLSNLPEGTKIEFGGTLEPANPQYTWNAVGKLTGSDPKLSADVILLSSHIDHLGVQPNRPGNDKIFNGADDDASGSVAVLELARVLAAGERPKRTVYFVGFGSEEAGGFGSGYFVNNLPFPKERLIANLQFEMIGRPDPKVKPEELWLTGYERSNLGPELARRGAKLVQDPHPTQNFFQRSDNYTLARQGVIAHTVSSFGLHSDYHQASDELKTIDFTHMTRAINSMVEPVRWLANSAFVPAWNEGKKP